MLISETTCDFEPFARVAHATEIGDQLDAGLRDGSAAAGRPTLRTGRRIGRMTYP